MSDTTRLLILASIFVILPLVIAFFCARAAIRGLRTGLYTASARTGTGPYSGVSAPLFDIRVQRMRSPMDFWLAVSFSSLLAVACVALAGYCAATLMTGAIPFGLH